MRNRWRLTPLLVVLTLLVAPIACATGDGVAPGNGWEYETATEGDVTTVRTTAGSRWGAPGTLVEDLSIGVEEGDEPYMFAMIGSVWPADDMILVSDFRLPAVRAFDYDGNFLFQVGGPGQGPGEYERPMAAAVLPHGNIVVVEGSKVHVYDGGGTYLEQWTEEQTGMMFFGPGTVTVGLDGTVYRRAPIMDNLQRGRMSFGSMRWGMKPLGPDGPGEIIEAPATDYEAPTVRVAMGDNVAMMMVPFAPRHQWTLTPNGTFVAGVPTEYRFTIHAAAGHQTLVQKYWEPVPVSDGEAEIRMRGQRVVINGSTPEIDWGDVEMPTTKPAYDNLFATRDGHILAVRSGPATVDPACLAPDAESSPGSGSSCIDGVTWGDLFDGEGMFIGSFEIPSGTQLMSPYIDHDALWTGFQDELGTVTVKRFRIVPPAGATTD